MSPATRRDPGRSLAAGALGLLVLAVLPGLPALLAPPAIAQQRDFSKVEIKATKVAGSVYMLEGSGGNIGVSVGSDGILIVDDQFAPLADNELQLAVAQPLERGTDPGCRRCDRRASGC